MKKKFLCLAFSFSVLFSSFLGQARALDVDVADSGALERSAAPVLLNIGQGLPLDAVGQAANFSGALKLNENLIPEANGASHAVPPLPIGEIDGASEKPRQTSESFLSAQTGNEDQAKSVLAVASGNRPQNSLPSVRGNFKNFFVSALRNFSGQLSQVLSKNPVNFDGESTALRGVKLYDRSKPFDGGIVSLKHFSLAPMGAVEAGSPFTRKAVRGNTVYEFHPIALAADPSDLASVEKALRKLVNSHPSRYGLSDQYGSPDQDMAKVHVQRLTGQADQADSIIAVFRQWKKGTDHDGSPYYLPVDGANLRFHIKVLNGKPVLMSVEGGFAPNINPEIMASMYTDAQLNQMAQRSLKSLNLYNSDRNLIGRRVRHKTPGVHFNIAELDHELLFLTREIVYVNNVWRAVSIYQGNDLNGNPVMILVDVKTGEAFPVGVQGIRAVRPPRSRNAAGSPISGSTFGRGTTLAPGGGDHGPTAPMALPNAKVFDAQGKIVTVTDENGAFTIPANVNDGKPLKITVRLDGIYGPVVDDDPKDAPIAVTLTVTPGRKVKVTLNPTGDDEQQAANVNAYVYSYRLFNWFKSYLGLMDPRFYAPLAGAIHTNGTSLPGNADYNAVTDGFYLMKRAIVPVKVRGKDGKIYQTSITFENTSQPSISLHELGHRFVHKASQIDLSDEQKASPAYRFVQNLISSVMGGGPNEALADIVSMFMRNSPLVGNGLILDPLPGMPTFIRTGENKTVYARNSPDIHNQGETQMGTAWMSRKDMMKAMGEAEGALRAALIFIAAPLYAQPEDVASALTHALLADMSKDGSIPHEAIIRAHAKKDHGLEIPAPTLPSGKNGAAS